MRKRQLTDGEQNMSAQFKLSLSEQAFPILALPFGSNEHLERFLAKSAIQREFLDECFRQRKMLR